MNLKILFLIVLFAVQLGYSVSSNISGYPSVDNMVIQIFIRNGTNYTVGDNLTVEVFNSTGEFLFNGTTNSSGMINFSNVSLFTTYILDIYGTTSYNYTVGKEISIFSRTYVPIWIDYSSLNETTSIGNMIEYSLSSPFVPMLLGIFLFLATVIMLNLVSGTMALIIVALVGLLFTQGSGLSDALVISLIGGLTLAMIIWLTRVMWVKKRR